MIRTRFAPSPTGFLHIGGARTALFCWLYAHKMKGTFILRIEDTDLERSTEASVQAILDGMSWLNLGYDEGPYYQTKRFDRYSQVIQQLLNDDNAYYCTCSKERLAELREEQMALKQKPRYDGHCRELQHKPVENAVVRFKNPKEGVVSFHDLIRGDVSFANQELDDLIIARADGSPTYNFTVVVDDWDMQISHVIRGDDHINNTPRQINIFKALGVTPPIYAHVPMILGGDGKRLSKRHGAEGVMQYRDEGFLPEALLNYLVRLGWSHGDQEVFSIDEMIEYFDIADINRAPAAFNLDKLLWLNQHYLKTGDRATVAKSLMWHLDQLGIDVAMGPPLAEIIDAQCDRVKTLKEMAEKSIYFFMTPDVTDEMREQVTPELKRALLALRDKLRDLPTWTKEGVHDALVAVAHESSLKMGKLAQPVRLLVTGGTVSPSIDLTIRLIGREKTLERLDRVLK